MDVATSGEIPARSSAEAHSTLTAGQHANGEVNNLVDLYRHHQQRIYRYCLALLRNPDDAEDATQETFTRAAPFLPNLPGDLSAYLTTVARNICCDVVRARSRRLVPIESVPLADLAVSPERQSVDWDVVRRMWRQLSPSERLLFAYTFAGYKYEEIASRTGMSRPSVSVGLARARRRLRDLAAATGTLGLLALGIRRLFDRVSRRVSSALASAQGTVLSLADQVGIAAVSLVTGVAAIASAGGSLPAITAAPPMLPTAASRALTGAAATVTVSAGHVATSAAHDRAPSQPRGSSIPPSTSAAGTAVQAVSSRLPDAGATPDKMQIDSMSVSPDYANDHTLFLFGADDADCVWGLACPLLLRSSDGGATWKKSATVGWPSGTMLYPPAYPSDTTLFALFRGNELDESTDGGHTFLPIAFQTDAAGIAPDSVPGDYRIAAVLANAKVTMLYDIRGTQVTVTPGPVLPAINDVSQVVFTSPTTFLVSAFDVNFDKAIFTCTIGAATCAAPHDFTDNGGGAVWLSTSRSFATDHLIAGWDTTTVYLSHDSGASFTPVYSAPSGDTVDSASLGQGPAGPRLVVGTTRPSGVRGAVGTLYSDDLGHTLTAATGDLVTSGTALQVAAIQDGTILVASTFAGEDFTLHQTHGQGHWARVY